MTDEYFAELEQWKICVGTAMLGFGEIELITLKCLEYFPKDNIYKFASSLTLGRRIDLLMGILMERRNETEIENIFQMLGRAKKLAEFRNLLAHNPLMANVFEHKHTGDLEIKMLISAIRSGKNAVDLEDVKELSDEVESLASQLWISFSHVTGNDEINK
jgi:hypothetical protein